MPDEQERALEEFARFARALKGDAKSEAQSILERFFRALGHPGVLEAWHAAAFFDFSTAKV